MPVRFSYTEVQRLVSIASAPSAGRTVAERLTEALDGVRALVPFQSTDIFLLEPLRDRGTVELVQGIEPGDLKDYVAHYRHHDPMNEFVLERSPRVRTLSDAATPRALARTEFSDLLGRYRITAIAGWAQPIGRGLHVAVGLQRWRGTEDFSDKERAVLGLVAPLLVGAIAEKALPAGPLAALTPRERAVVELVIRGLRDRQVASRLGIGFATVRSHLQSSFDKVGVSNRTELLDAVLALNGEPCGR